MSYKAELDAMIWSFSRLHSYEQCPYKFYLSYIEEDKGIDNFYAENGKILHSIHEKILKNELQIEKCIEYYLDEFDCITENEKPNIMKNTKEACISYLENLDLSQLDDYEILGIELQVNTKIGKYNMIGYIDLLLKNKTTQEIIILDHKSAKYMMKKNGIDILKGKEDDLLAYKRQLYLYSKYVIENYGTPTYLVWNHFKDNKICKVDFIEEEYKATIDWFKKLLKNIYKDKEFKASKSFVMCNSLCGYRKSCVYKNEE